MITGEGIVKMQKKPSSDMYERAVLRKPVGKTFGATVDLWSIGVGTILGQTTLSSS